MMETLNQDLTKRMTGAFEVFSKELTGLRTGRASPALLDGVLVEAYGNLTPLHQVGTVNVAEARLLTVQVWDQSLVKAVEKAIRDSSLGVNPSVDGHLVRVPLPDLTEERRLELVKIAHKYAEGARIAVRAVRRDGLDSVKKNEKNKLINEDEARRLGESIQELTDKFIKKIDELLIVKEKDIKHI